MIDSILDSEVNSGIRDLRELLINYQELFILENSITISWFSKDACSNHFEVRGYTLNTGVPVLSPDYVFTVGQETILKFERTDNTISFKLIALNETRVPCQTSRNIYYRFNGMINDASHYNGHSKVLFLQLIF